MQSLRDFARRSGIATRAERSSARSRRRRLALSLQ
jgi:hypothetical protein